MLRTNFIYNGKSLADYQMKMYDADDTPSGVARTIDKAAQNSSREIPNHYTTYRNEVLVHHFLIIRDPEFFPSQKEMRLTDKDIHILKSWLFSTKTPAELKLPQDDEEIEVSYFGVFTDVQYFIVGTECYGLKLTFTCNAPYGFSPITSKRFWINAADTQGDFVNNIVEFANMIPPTIVIRANSGMSFAGETLALTNQHDGGNTMNITLKSGCHRIDIDCRTKIATGYYMDGQIEKTQILTLTDLGVNLYQAEQDNTKDFHLIDTYSLYWLSLVPGSNVLHFETTPADGQQFNGYSVEIRTRYIIEAGGF